MVAPTGREDSHVPRTRGDGQTTDNKAPDAAEAWGLPSADGADEPPCPAAQQPEGERSGALSRPGRIAAAGLCGGRCLPYSRNRVYSSGQEFCPLLIIRYTAHKAYRVTAGLISG